MYAYIYIDIWVYNYMFISMIFHGYLCRVCFVPYWFSYLIETWQNWSLWIQSCAELFAGDCSTKPSLKHVQIWDDLGSIQNAHQVSTKYQQNTLHIRKPLKMFFQINFHAVSQHPKGFCDPKIDSSHTVVRIPISIQSNYTPNMSPSSFLDKLE